MKLSHAVPVLLALMLPSVAFGASQPELLELKNTILNLVDALVEQGVLTREKADALIKAAADKATAEAQGGGAATARRERNPGSLCS